MLLSDVRALFDQKVRAGLFSPMRRYAHDHVREDRLQDAIAMTWLWFKDHAEQGEILPDAYLCHYCSLRVREPRQRFVPCGRPHAIVVDLEGVHPRESRTIDLDDTIDRTTALRTLSAEDRAILLARAEGDDLDTIAAAAGHSRSWASRRVQAALERLREHAS